MDRYGQAAIESYATVETDRIGNVFPEDF